ncbi:MAG TPA: alpha/beta hydrolase [Pyrinomonadaceae bacterium]|jgi:pimeloyl-ACP methyl ester carboxylesterase
MKIYFSIGLILVLCPTVFAQNKNSGNASKNNSIALESCEVPGAQPDSKEKALCGTYEVFENRALRRGRKIGLKIVVFPATGQNKMPDPVFYIAGGPGSSATEDAPYVAADLLKVREKRDLVFLDQRGTGGSHPLNCTFFNAADLQSYLEHWNPPEDVKKCRDELEKNADLKLYTTTIAMDDLDEVRAALGFDEINIDAGSYGTRAAQEYIRRHGAHVRAAHLHGVSVPSQFMPRDFPQHTERALQGVLDECLADETCRGAFPNIRAEQRAVLEKLIAGRVETEVKNPADSKLVRVKLSRDLAAEAIRYMMYSTYWSSRVPLFLHLAAAGNFTPLAETAILYRRELVGAGATGLYLSVTCAEDLPFIKPGEGEKDTEKTFLGSYRLRQQREACAVWRRGIVPKDYAEPVRSAVPILIMTGEWDPVTPPLYGDMVAKNFRNSLHIVVKSGGHGFGGLDGLDCVTNLIAEFFDRGSVKGLDSACVKNIRRQGFQLKLPEPQN